MSSVRIDWLFSPDQDFKNPCTQQRFTFDSHNLAVRKSSREILRRHELWIKNAGVHAEQSNSGDLPEQNKGNVPHRHRLQIIF